jgi:hypothetical protein
MNRANALTNVTYHLDNALAVRTLEGITDSTRLVVFAAGFEPMVVAVSDYLGGRLDADEAEEIAADWLEETKWFTNGRDGATHVF